MAKGPAFYDRPNRRTARMYAAPPWGRRKAARDGVVEYESRDTRYNRRFKDEARRVRRAADARAIREGVTA